MTYLFNGAIRDKDCAVGREGLNLFRGLDSDGFLAFWQTRSGSACLFRVLMELV
jgi:hypothetical protein